MLRQRLTHRPSQVGTAAEQGARGQAQASLERTQGRLGDSIATVGRLEAELAAAGDKYTFLQELRGYIADLCDMLQVLTFRSSSGVGSSHGSLLPASHSLPQEVEDDDGVARQDARPDPHPAPHAHPGTGPRQLCRTRKPGQELLVTLARHGA